MRAPAALLVEKELMLRRKARRPLPARARRTFCDGKGMGGMGILTVVGEMVVDGSPEAKVESSPVR